MTRGRTFGAGRGIRSITALGTVVALAVAVAANPGCTATTAAGAVKALQGTGPTSFVCLAPPTVDGGSSVALPLSQCSSARSADVSIPHLYALTTQPLRGEIAVIDLTVTASPLVDSDPATPGTNFLPVGAMPTDIVSTPGGMASFVSVAEVGYEGIFALVSERIRGGATHVSDWPACSLPETPGRIELVVDAPGPDGATRPSCDAAYGAPDADASCGPAGLAHCHGDLATDAAAAGSPGRYKLLVTLPKKGGVAVIDAQAILDQENGAFEPCRVERFLPLDVALSPEQELPLADRVSCVERPPSELSVSTFVSKPSDIAIAARPSGGFRAYIADAGAPTIHRIDMPTPCDPVETTPLVATSAEDPTRVVTTSRVAVSPLTFELQRYAYALDDVDGSLMVFDVSDTAVSRRPLERPHAEHNPFQPRDRIRFGSPPREIVLFEQRSEQSDATTGATLPVRCDPSSSATDAAAKYRTANDFSGGAGPRKLRGVFGLAVLASGNVVAIDIDDFDDACRGPKTRDALFGCSDTAADLPGASTEYSCNSVLPHQPRASSYLAFRENVVATQPGIQALPLLFDIDGTTLEPNAPDAPRMRATVPTHELSVDLTLPVGSTAKAIDRTSGLLVGTDADGANDHVLAMNQEDPRAHILAQAWSVTYEGSLVGFVNRFASLEPKDGGYEFRDPSTSFCARGVMGASAVADELIELEGLAAAAAGLEARALADYVQVISDTPVITDKYWNEQSVCSFTACQQTYGTSQNPLVLRDLRIDVAKDDVLVVSPREGLPSPELKCCFPNVVQYKIRGGSQWIVTGSQVGFLSHGARDDDGVCRSRCDSDLARLNGRVREIVAEGPVRDDDVRAFINPFFRFAIRRGAAARRDMRFDFATQAQFNPLQVTLFGANGSTDVQPTAATFLPLTREVVVSDGSLQGLTMLSTGTLSVSRQYQ